MYPAAPDVAVSAEKSLTADHVEYFDKDVGPPSASDVEIRSPEEIRLVRKLDTIMMPILWLMYWLNYLDRNAITVARLDKMEKNLHMTSIQYQTCVSILFVGYILGQIPSNMVITKVRPSIFMASFMALWAIASTLTGISRSFSDLLVTRFFLGLLESPFYPGALYMLSMFYTKKELATRISILFSANVCGTASAGLVAIGIFKLEGRAGLQGWRWLFIVQGLVTFVVAILAAFILPDEPLQTRWLTKEERQLAHSRVQKQVVQVKDNAGPWAGLKDAVTDYKVWLLVLMDHLNMASVNYKNFFPTVVGTLGFSRTATLALTCPPYLIAAFFTIGVSWSSGKLNERTFHVVFGKIVAIFGFILACATLNTGARYFAMCVFASGAYSVAGINLAWIASTCGQTKEKKAVALALANTMAGIAPIYTPYLWPASDAPRYTIAMGFSAGTCMAAILVVLVIRWCLIRENRKIRQTNSEAENYYVY